MTISLFLCCFLLVCTLQQYIGGIGLRQQSGWQRQQRLYIRDPYCLNWNGENCTRCPVRYYLQNGKCTPVNPRCRDFDQNNGNCLNCYVGYEINNGLCSVSRNQQIRNQYVQNNQISSGSDIFQSSDSGCSNFDFNRNCVQCSSRYYKSSNGICIKVSDLCRSWDQFNGNCQSCYTGYDLSNGNCMTNSNYGSFPINNLQSTIQYNQPIPISFTQSQPQQIYQPQLFTESQTIPLQSSGPSLIPIDNSESTFFYPAFVPQQTLESFLPSQPLNPSSQLIPFPIDMI